MSQFRRGRKIKFVNNQGRASRDSDVKGEHELEANLCKEELQQTPDDPSSSDNPSRATLRQRSESPVKNPCRPAEENPDLYFPNRALVTSEDCRNFLKGTCVKGNACSRRHPKSAIVDGKEVRFTSDRRVLETRAYHNEICLLFTKNKCTYGASCWRVHPHSASSQTESDLLKVTQTLPIVNALRPVIEDPENFFPTKAFSSSEDCQEFLRGDCLRGRLCHRKHPKSADVDGKEIIFVSDRQVEMTRGLNNDVCRLYLRKECRQGTRCNNIHPVQDDDGRQPEAPARTLSSTTVREDPAGVALESDVVRPREFSEPVVNLPQRVFKPEQSSSEDVVEVCRSFARGRCYLKHCKRLHVSPDSGSKDTMAQGAADTIIRDESKPSSTVQHGQEDVTSNESGRHSTILPNTICRDFIRGRCWRLHCNKQHISSQKSPALCDSIRIVDDPASDDVGGSGSSTKDAQDMDSKLSDSSVSIDDDVSWELSEDSSFWEQSSSSSSNTSLSPSMKSVDARPYYKERRPMENTRPICLDFLQGACWRGPRCNLRHFKSVDRNDVPPAVPPGLAPRTQVEEARQSSEPPFVMLFEHIRVTFRDGFDIENVTTGFESPWVTLSNVPSSATREQIVSFVQSHGDFVEIKFSDRPNQERTTVQIKYQDVDRARISCGKLSSSMFLGGQVWASLPISIFKGKKVLLQDAVVRMEWDAPGRTAYAGYSNMKQVDRALEVASSPVKGHIVSASLHNGVPAVGVFTVKFEYLPPSANDAFMRRFAKPEEVMWEPANYTHKQGAIDGIYRLLNDTEGLLSFEVQPSALSNGKLRGWAQFSSRTQAKAAASYVNLRKPTCTGRTRIYAHYLPNVAFVLHLNTFNNTRADLFEFKNLVYQRRDGSALFFTYKETAVIARITAVDADVLAELKAQFESTLRGDTVRSGKEVVWDRYFLYPAGFEFVRDIEARVPGSSVIVDARRRRILLFGNYLARQRAKSMLVAKFGALRAQKIRFIPLDGRFAFVFLSSELKELQDKHGSDCIYVDLSRKVIRVRGSDSLYEATLAAVRNVEARTSCSPEVDSYQPGNFCPMCLNVIKSRVTLPCGHASCRTCMAEYLESAVETRYFPLTCLGDGASCKKPIPFHIARSVLSANKFEALAEASLSNYVDARPDVFHYCPTPDCQQIYRSVSADSSGTTVLQCPSCLVEICPTCHVKYHEGFSCAEFGAQTDGFEEWKRENGIKNCPGCAAPIEKTEGCNHMVCTRCHTHACWVCSKTFPKGEGIYAHMSQEHGGFGLEDVPLDPYVF